jgi:mannosyltransferase OCH1-like enzyme
MLITTIICILVLIISCFIYIIYKKNSQTDIYTIITTKQIIKHKYQPPSSPKKTIIPKKLFQTWHSKDLPTKMQETVETLKKQNPELEYFLFDDNDCIDYIQEHFETNVVDAYNKLIPGAYKADLWRYCVMYIEGGVYLDIKYQCVDGFKFIDIMDREHFVLDTPYYWKPEIQGIYNAFIIAKPGNPLLLSAIKRIVHNTQTDYYGFSSLYPTGPRLLGELYFGNINNNTKMLYSLDLVHNNIDSMAYVIYKNQFILKEYSEYRKEQRAKQKQKHYGELWNERAIYNK